MSGDHAGLRKSTSGFQSGMMSFLATSGTKAHVIVFCMLCLDYDRNGKDPPKEVVPSDSEIKAMPYTKAPNCEWYGYKVEEMVRPRDVDEDHRSNSQMKPDEFQRLGYLVSSHACPYRHSSDRQRHAEHLAAAEKRW